MDSALLQRIYGEFIENRNITGKTFTVHSEHLTQQQIIEFCSLAEHYDGIAATKTALRVPVDFAD